MSEMFVPCRELHAPGLGDVESERFMLLRDFAFPRQLTKKGKVS